MDQTQRPDYHTWELFQVKEMRPNNPAGNQEHVYAAPPPTVLHKSRCGVVVPVPSPLDWRDD
jgi:hypothetical protein